jgi:hypothetical protein
MRLLDWLIDGVRCSPIFKTPSFRRRIPMKALRNALGVCVVTLTFSGSAFAGVMQTGCKLNGSGHSMALALEAALDVVQGIMTLL